MASPDTRPAQRNGAVPAFSRVQELTKFNGRSFCNTRTGLFSTARPATGAVAAVGRRLPHEAPAFRTGKRIYKAALSEADIELERRRRAILCAYGTATGLLPPPYAQSQSILERTIRRHGDGGGGRRLARLLRDDSTSKLLQSPTAHQPGVREALRSSGRWKGSHASHSVSLPRLQEMATVHQARSPESCEVVGSGSVPALLPPRPSTTNSACQVTSPGSSKDGADGSPHGFSESAAERQEESITQVSVAPIGDPCLSDPMEGYEITATDLLTVFSELDAACTGAVPLADFEAAMLRLGYTPEAAARLFAALDTNRDGVLTFADWSSEPARHVAHALAHRLIRQRLVGHDPVRAQRPPSSLTDQKMAMESLLVDLGVTAKTNFIKIKGLFDEMDTDGSGDISTDELTLTVERILRQKISRGVKAQLMHRFDRNGDGVVSSTEFLNKVVSNPMATLYAFMPSGVCLS